ncbi:phage portal protein [Leucobacter sp. W1153]|uniref:phage portal protein n=1 Tax=Leucobacter sp. W1153 TaxID=3439064 RepID=UPI003F2DA9EF
MANTLISKLRDWLMRDDTPADPSFVIPSRSQDEQHVGVGDALGLSIVYRAISIHTIAVKQLSFAAFRDGVELTRAQSPTWLRRPDINATRSVFLEETVVSLACAGNAYWRIKRDSRGGVANLEVLNPLSVTMQTNAAGQVVKYGYKGSEFQANEIQHLRLLRVPGTPSGLGPIQAAQREMRGAMDVRDYAGNWFSGSGAPVAGYLTSDQAMTQEAAQETRTRWQAATSDRDGVPVLGAGMKFTPLFLSPEDALWIEAQKFNTTSIARLFGVPASLMLATVEGNTQTYSNIAQDWLGYVRFSLMQYLVEIEDAFSQLLQRGTDAKFNVEALLRTDAQTRYATHNLALTGGWMTVAEVREIEGLTPMVSTPEPRAEDTNE